ncbi:tyrosine-type recombinase/integrase [Acidithiobacillus sp. IBUN Pt1247-S3]|uniref:tyrosine-type recombinase/integrase n=1 Tax=Acidithiobacillus sp. IBUN Pt1247-S3 TaxID=3166642 RepID=UPI0034E3DF42
MIEGSERPYSARVREIWETIQATPGVKRGSRLFQESEIKRYSSWLVRETEIADSMANTGTARAYGLFLQNLQGDGPSLSVGENERESLTQRLSDRVLHFFEPMEKDQARVSGEKLQEKALKSRLRGQAKFLQFLNLLIRLGTAQELWQWCPPTVPRLLDREPTPFTPDGLAGYRYVQRARNLFWEDFQRGTEVDERISEGRILLAALLYGGLGEVAALRELHTLLRTGVPLQHFPRPGWSFLDLEIPMGRGGKRLRRWFLDPLSETLFLWHIPSLHSQEESTKRDVLRAMDAYLHTLPKDRGKYLRARLLITAIPQALLVELPQFLGAYGAGTLTAHAIYPECWSRLYGYTGNTVTKPSLSEENEDDSPTLAMAEVNESVQTVLWLQSLRRILRTDNRSQALKALAENPDSAATDVLSQRFYAWAKHLLKNGSAYRHHLAMRTIRRYVSRLAALMLQLVDNPADIEKFGELSWRQLYGDLLDLMETENQRVFAVRAIREWHQFLVEAHGASPISEQDLGGLAIDVVPDARIISEEEFTEVKRVIAQGQHIEHHAQLPTVLILIAILGFRCGLRRMEVLRLRLMDCHLFGKAVLLIRPFAERSLKSRNATRAIPLYALLTAKELHYLSEWAQERKEMGAHANDYLFVLPEIGHNPISQETAMSRIHQAMRQVTGEEKMHFHHLRHSFANHLLWRLSLSQLSMAAVPPAWLSEQQAAREFAERLFGSAHHTRKQLYAVTSLLGHSTPEISLNHYVHNLDLLLALYVRGQIPSVSARDWQAYLPERHQGTLYRVMASSGINGLLERIRKQHKNRVQIPGEILGTREARATKKTNELVALESRIDNAWKMLLQGMVLQKKRGKEVWESLAEEGEYSCDQLRAMAAKAQEIYALMGQMGLRHRPCKLPDFGGELEIALPAKIFREVDRKIYRQLLPGFWQSVQKDADGVGGVLDGYLRQAWRDAPGYFLGKSVEAPEDILAFRQLLFDWGVPHGQIAYISYDPLERSAWRQRWREALHLNKRDTIDIRRLPVSAYAERWLHVYPRFRRAGKDASSASPGFSYLLIMGAIVLAGIPYG